MKRSLYFILTIGWSVVTQPVTVQAEVQAHPLVKQISETKYKIGKVHLDKATREITFPATTHVTDSETVIEYILTHSTGEKTHETLLTTDVQPIQINLAFKLLNYPESQGLLIPNTKLDLAARFSIHVSHEGKNTPITSWLQHRDTRKPMPLTPWVYNGSFITRKRFMAEFNGNIFSIISEPSSLGNYAGEDREDDTLWFPSSRTPKPGTQVTVTIKPWKS
ncbi:YdjY domain-containing protein [Akkermansiaceae bacterium]|nr:YdjY domain-containing protein [Akkermansiaceae bacterium]